MSPEDSTVRIIVVHGRGAKPPKECKLRYVRQVLIESVRRVDPKVARWLKVHPEVIQLAYCADLFHRRFKLRPESCAGYREPIRRLLHESERYPNWVLFRSFLRDLGADVAGLLARLFSLETRRLYFESHFSDVIPYFSDAAFAAAIRQRLKRLLVPALRSGRRILLIGHSLGSIVAYDTLWEISHRVRHRSIWKRAVTCFLTLGSPLGDETVRAHLLGWDRPGRQRFPTNVQRWVNLSARGDLICYDARLGNDFRPMRRLGLIPDIEEKANLCTIYRGRDGVWNPHKLYGYLILPEVGRLVADFLGIRWRMAHVGVKL